LETTLLIKLATVELATMASSTGGSMLRSSSVLQDVKARKTQRTIGKIDFNVFIIKWTIELILLFDRHLICCLYH
jgi:hypothetical protein